jgi:multisubunit Na+/H+ antiporter MnhC subunit
VADKSRGKLDRKIQGWERESEALSKPKTTDPTLAAQSEEGEREAGMRLPAVLIWTVAIVVGLATGSVPLALGMLVAGHILLQALFAVRRAAS